MLSGHAQGQTVPDHVATSQVIQGGGTFLHGAVVVHAYAAHEIFIFPSRFNDGRIRQHSTDNDVGNLGFFKDLEVAFGSRQRQAEVIVIHQSGLQDRDALIAEAAAAFHKGGRAVQLLADELDSGFVLGTQLVRKLGVGHKYVEVRQTFLDGWIHIINGPVIGQDGTIRGNGGAFCSGDADHNQHHQGQENRNHFLHGE